METLVTDSTAVAARIIRRGGLVAFPTETVYGLGADVFNEVAVGGIFEAKRRPADNPLIAHIGELAQVRELASGVTPYAERLIEAFFPGPLTVVLPRSKMVPDIATAGLETIGIRMPRHATAREFLVACGTPVVAPSANLSGRPSPTRWRDVLDDLDGRIDCILKGEATEIGLESTVVDCTGDVPLLLRAGAVSLEDLRRVVPETRVYEPNEDEAVRSPGLRHRHYSPRAAVSIGTGPAGSDAAYIGLRTPADGFAVVRICDSAEIYARELFSFFRECDRSGIVRIVCEPVEESGIGRALMDRLRRAAKD